jgi:hypothetical protein
MPKGTTLGKPGSTATKTLPKPGPSAKEEQQEAPAGRSGLFNQTPPEEGFQMPLGTFRAYFLGGDRKVDGKKLSIRVEYEVTQHDEHEGKKLSTWYNFFDEDGTPMRGIGFFKKDMALLGKEIPVCESEELEELDDFLRELSDERPLCVVNVKENKGYQNLYLQGLAAE